VIVTDEAFDELLDRVQLLEAGDDDGECEEAELRRRQFAFAVDRAVKMVVTKRDGRVWYTQTLRRHGCRLHFVRTSGTIHLIACLALDEDDEDYST
jgi:hypothetical protein